MDSSLLVFDNFTSLAALPAVAFNFTLEPHSVTECAVAFLFNGSTVNLSRSSPSSSLTVVDSDLDTYSLKAELSCGFHKSTGALVQSPSVFVYIHAVDGKQVSRQVGFRVDPSPEARILELALVRSGQEHESVDTSFASSDHSLSDHKHHELDLSSENSSQLQSSEKHYIPDDQRGQHLCPIHSLLSHLTSAFSEDCIERFKSKVQAVMTNIKSHIGCQKQPEDHKEKSDNGYPVSRPASSDLQPTASPLKKFSDAQSPLVIALEALASILGLSGLLFFLRRRCCSLRRRVERLADREERMKASEYRRAARKEAWKRRWSNLKKACTCCFGSYDCEPEDEEKRALVSNAAEEGLDDDLETSMAQLDGLQYAHEIVADMIRSRRRQDHGSAAVVHSGDVAFHYATHETRSRASSLPSYNSDVLPDYSSQPDMAEVERHVRVINSFRRSGSPASSTGSSRCTPDSSIPDISTRPSQETLRTDPDRF
ncbi:hypothetical protein B9Z65_2000 [Elsinoe australis]|uniref:Uncharacterized protein n=1 Tax=Elsinoe australis TaxID=40998 RepID=A0A2P7YMR2_9PEZI|nr:hypothetical protein B9Z65_2000 [Elsinoe australis]